MLRYLTVYCIVVILSGCAMNRAAAEEITVEGIYIKNLDHPFSGPAVLASGGQYRLSGERAQDLSALKDRAKVKITGKLYTRKRSIPEAGTFREITEQVIEVTKVTVIDK
jgi:hypothetical protein